MFLDINLPFLIGISSLVSIDFSNHRLIETSRPQVNEEVSIFSSTYKLGLNLCNINKKGADDFLTVIQ